MSISQTRGVVRSESVRKSTFSSTKCKVVRLGPFTLRHIVSVHNLELSLMLLLLLLLLRKVPGRKLVTSPDSVGAVSRGGRSS